MPFTSTSFVEWNRRITETDFSDLALLLLSFNYQIFLCFTSFFSP